MIGYTKEQDNWLIENFSKLGRSETTKQFNYIFNENKKEEAIKKHCNTTLNLHIDKTNWAERAKKANESPIGTIYFEKGTKYIKIRSDGKNRRENYVPLAKYIYEKKYGPIPNNYMLIYLDGDHNNCDLSNLRSIPRKYLVILSRHNNWYAKKELTECGIAWCDLYYILKEKIQH